MSFFILDRSLRHLVRHGHLTVIDGKGKPHLYGGREGPKVTVRLHHPLLPLRLALNPRMVLGQAYTDGALTIEQGTLYEFLEIVLTSQEWASQQTPLYRFLRKLETFVHTRRMLNRITDTATKIQRHYDLNNHLYELFLDEDLQYSCGYFCSEADSLTQAQVNKKHHIASKLLLEPGMRVLDIGSGWGGLALFLAKEFGVHVTGVTLSQDQFHTSVHRAAKANLSTHVEFKLLDYRLETGTYDRIVSVGMFEHVGRPQFFEFFEHLNRLLAADGVALLHTIAKMWDPGPVNAWMERHIFPGSYLPTLSELAPAIERFKFWLTDLENWRLHYAQTLGAWHARFQENRDEIQDMFDERFCRMWEFYLLGCKGAFCFQELCVFQLQLTKRISSTPITRDYMYQNYEEADPHSAKLELVR